MCNNHIRINCATIASAVVLAVVAFGLLAPSAALADDVGTAFTYQGNLELLGSPVTDTCGFEFSLWNDETDTAPAAQVGSTLSQSIDVTDGVFDADLDFGSGTIVGQARWLEISVCCPPDNCDSPPTNYTTLTPRQELKPTPHALALPGLYTEQNATSPNIIGGYIGNSVEPDVVGATIAGGGEDSKENRVFDDYGTVSGGLDNQAGSDDADPLIGPFATVGGGGENTASGSASSIGGGVLNNASEDASTVGGGLSNTASEDLSTVGGGYFNTASGIRSIVGGGAANTASGDSSTIGGGIGNTASSFYSTISGGGTNTANGLSSTVPGGRFNLAGGDYSFAAGRSAKVRDAAASGDADGDEGSFVWADASNFDFPSATEANITPDPNQFLARTTGGVVFVSAVDSETGDSTAGVELAAGGGSWSALSSRDSKTNVDKVDGREILERLRHLPIATWNYKAQDESIRHIGPMAQDFSDAFGVGEKETMITTIDADGVALAAIKGLYEIAREKDCEIAGLRSENAAIKNRLAQLEALVQALANSQTEGGR